MLLLRLNLGTAQLAGIVRSSQRVLAATLIGVIALSGKVREVEVNKGQIASKVALQGTVREVERLSGSIAGKAALQGNVREAERLTGQLAAQSSRLIARLLSRSP